MAYILCRRFYVSAILKHCDIFTEDVRINNNNIPGSRRRLPSLPMNRSPRNSIGGEGDHHASNIIQMKEQLKYGRKAPSPNQKYGDKNWNSQALAHQDISFETSTSEYGFIQFSCYLEKSNFYINVWSAQGLMMAEDDDSISLPYPYTIVRLYSSR